MSETPGAGIDVTKCTSADCAMRFPCPVGDVRHGTCPLCASPTEVLDSYRVPPVDRLEPQPRRGVVVGVVDNVRSALNVGTMLRSADGACLDHMHLCGLSPAADHPKVLKTSLGAEQTVSASSHADAMDCATRLQNDGFAIWAFELTERSVALASVEAVPPKLAIVVGNEIAGVDPGLLALADQHVHLEMGGHKTSLNVGVAFGIAAYAVRSLPAH